MTEIREAARLMRDLAASCEQAPWTAEVTERGNAWINLPAHNHAWGMHGFPDEARYVASMNPAVALAVADWLAGVAAAIERGDLHPETYPVTAEVAAARAVTRAYLGGAR